MSHYHIDAKQFFSPIFHVGLINGCDEPRKGFIKKKNKCVYELGCINDDDFFIKQDECYESLQSNFPFSLYAH